MKIRTIVLLAASFVMVALSAAADQGISIAVLGDVSVLRGEQVLKLSRGTTVQAGDRIRTAPGASAQFRMSDGSILAVPQKSEVEITKYRYSEENPKEGVALFSLIKGGLRTLTGKIGVHSRPNYEVKTLVATIGIRGTHFRLQLCEKDCESEGAPAKDGLYGGVTEGRIAVTNRASEREFGMDEYFFLADANAIPELLPGPPSLLNDRLASLSAARRSGATPRVDMPHDLRPEQADLQKTIEIPTATATLAAIWATDTPVALALPQTRPIEERIAPTSLAHVVPADDFIAVGNAGTIRGQIVWMTDADIDLHMLAPFGNEVYYGRKYLSVNEGSSAQLDHDNVGNIIDLAPDKRVENITVTGSDIPTGNYTFFARSFSGNNGGLPTTVQIRVTGNNDLTSYADTFSLANNQNSNNYIVKYQGASSPPLYQVQPRDY